MLGEVNWIIETKGREYKNVAHKDKAIAGWCKKISQQTGQSWRYLKVPQQKFDASQAQRFDALLAEIKEPQTLFG